MTESSSSATFGGGNGRFPTDITISTDLPTSSSTGALSAMSANSTPSTATVTSPRNEFFVSQRSTDFEVNRVDTLSLEEQEILANIQELQLQLMQLRAEEDEDSDDEPQSSNSMSGNNSGQLIVVSNSLPVVLERNATTGRWKATKTTGGLDKLMCLTGVRSDLNFLWVGWVGQNIPKNEHESVRRLLLQHNCLPVFIPPETATRHNNFSSEVLWSLFHYVAEPVATTTTFQSAKRFSKQDWRAYESANESFADAIAEIYNEGDSVWIHDYHLMLLPSLLRRRIPLCHIGWFLHTPFPSSDVYSRLPVRAQLLTGVLQADLVGFQTYDYERHFVSTCQRLLGVDCSHKGIRSTFADRDHYSSIGVFPIGINIEPLARAASSAATLNRVNELHKKFGNKRIILGVDRLDNIKGIPHKLLAMEALLNRFPEWQHNVVLIQIGISSGATTVDSNEDRNDNNPATTRASSPSPRKGSTSPPTSNSSNTSSTESSSSAKKHSGIQIHDSGHQLEMSSQGFQNLLSHVNQLVGRINGTYGTLDYQPIHFIHQNVMSQEELCALYDLADVCMVTSTRDGMNLVAHEFIVCQQHFMRRKEERKKAARALASANTTSANASGSNTTDSKTTLDRSSPRTAPILSSQHSAEKIPTDWEGEEGGPGVLVLSEFAGCSQSLSGAIVINPWNTEDLALSVHQALSMTRMERELRQQKLYRYVSSNTATSWSMQFLSELEDAVQQNRKDFTQLPKLDTADIVQAYQNAHNRVIILDYDRTLTPQHSLLPLAAVGPNFKSLLDALSADERNTVFIVSGRERKFLETWLNGVCVGVAAEDGYFYRMNLRNEREHWKTMSKFHYDVASARLGAPSSGSSSVVETNFLASGDAQSRRRTSISSVPSYMSLGYESGRDGGANGIGSSGVSMDDSFHEEEDMSWKDLVLPTMIAFTDRTPGSYIEDKESCLTWHYGDADPHFGGWQAKDLHIILERQLLGTALEVYQGNNYVYVEHEGCTKTGVIEGILKHLSLPQQISKKNNHEVDFVLCVCDDVTDDQMFQAINTLVMESNERHEKLREQHKGISKSKSNMSLHGAIQRSSSTGSRANSTSSNINKPQLNRAQSHAHTDDEEDFDNESHVDEDNKVAFSRLHKVPVRMAENVSIYTVVVGQDVKHSGGRHACSYAVDSLADIRKVLKEFAGPTKKSSFSAGSSSQNLLGNDTGEAKTATSDE